MEHGLEHLTKDEQRAFLRECRRVIRPNGVMRISCPDLRTIIDDYLAGKIDRWAPGWEPKSPCEMVNHGLSLWGHRYVLDSNELTELAFEAGFEVVSFPAWRESAHEALRGLEVRPYCEDLIAELS